MPQIKLLLLLGILCGVSVYAGDFEEALNLLDKKDFPESRRILEKLVDKEPANGLYWFNLATASFNGGDFTFAANAFRKVIDLKSELSPAAWLCLVKCLRNLGEIDEARRELMEAKRLDVAGDLADAFADEQVKLDGLVVDETKPYWADLDVGLGYDSNVFLDGISNSETGKPIAESSLDVGIRSGEWGIGYQGYSKETLGYPTGRFLAQTLRARTGVASDIGSIRLSPALQHQIFGVTPYLIRALVDFVAQLDGKQTSGGVQYQFGRNFAQTSSYSFLDGNTQSISLFIDKHVDSIQFRTFYTLNIDDIQDLSSGSALLPLKGHSHGPGFKFLVTLAETWQMSATGAYLFRSYDVLAQPGNQERSDGQFSGYFRLSKAFLSSLSAFASVGLLFNHSTLDASSNVSDRNYSQTVAVTGVSWKITN